MGREQSQSIGNNYSNKNSETHYSERDIKNLITRTIAKRQREHFSDTLNYNDIDTMQYNPEQHNLQGGHRVTSTRNRYDKYSMQNYHTGGSLPESSIVTESEDQYRTLSTDMNNFTNLKKLIEQSAQTQSQTQSQTMSQTMSQAGGCGCDGGNDSVQFGGGSSSDTDDSSDDTDESSSSSEKPKHRKSNASQSRHKQKKNKNNYTTESSAQSEYSLTNSNSSTINIVPFYSTPSESEYFNHLKNKNRFN